MSSNEVIKNEELWDLETVENAENETSQERYLTFESDGLLLGISTEYVIEIITNPNITTLPMVPNYIKGIINLRGQVIPIIDTRIKMNKPPLEVSEDEISCVIILEINSSQIGITVDSVSQVIDVNVDSIQPVPKSSSNDPVTGMISLEGGQVLQMFNCEVLVQQ